MNKIEHKIIQKNVPHVNVQQSTYITQNTTTYITQNISNYNYKLTTTKVLDLLPLIWVHVTVRHV
jgi:hypothetical protein